MSIFGSQRFSPEETYDVPVYEGHIEVSDTGMEAIVTESLEEMFDIQSGIRIADVMIESAVLENYGSAEPLMESVAKDTFAKIRKALLDFWAKVKAFFTRATTYFGSLFVSGKKLTEKYKDELAKDKAGFKFKGFLYKMKAGDDEARKHVTTITDYLSNVANFTYADVSKGAKNASAHDTAGAASAHAEERNSKEDFDALVKKIGSSKKDIIEDLKKVYRGGDSKDEIVDFAGTKKEDLIARVAGGKDTIDGLKAAQKASDKNFKIALDLVKRAEKIKAGEKAEGDAATEQAKIVAALSHRYSLAKQGLGLMNTILGLQINMNKEAVSATTSVLRSYISYHPKGEKGEETKEEPKKEEKEATVENAILEAALRLI